MLHAQEITKDQSFVGMETSRRAFLQTTGSPLQSFFVGHWQRPAGATLSLPPVVAGATAPIPTNGRRNCFLSIANCLTAFLRCPNKQRHIQKYFTLLTDRNISFYRCYWMWLMLIPCWTSFWNLYTWNQQQNRKSTWHFCRPDSCRQVPLCFPPLRHL